jgi:predicted CXXCH cytochrome family protein
MPKLSRKQALTALLGVGWVVVLFTVLVSGSLVAQDDDAPDEVDYADSAPRECRDCHIDEYRAWVGSGHGMALENEEFQRVWTREREDPLCMSCHSPGLEADTRKLRYEGVGCGECHYTVDSTHRYDGDERYHGRMNVSNTPADCARCHGNDHALSFVEWEISAHNGPRTVDCLSCHATHSGGLLTETSQELCASCHMQEVPTTNPHMHVDGNCTDCHPAPVNTNNVHMHESFEVVANCVDCHMTTELDRWGRYHINTGHTYDVSLNACTSCHGSLHELLPDAEMP